MTTDEMRSTNNVCEECGLECNSYSGLKAHLNRHKSGQVDCDHCDYQAPSRGDMEQHMLDIHDAVCRKKCNSCDYSTLFLASLRRHELVHTNRTLKCSTCSYTTHSNPALMRHVRVQHAQSRIFRCSTCPYTAREQWVLNRHLRTHKHDKDLLRCKMCNFATDISDALERHMRMKHSDVTPLVLGKSLEESRVTFSGDSSNVDDDREQCESPVDDEGSVGNNNNEDEVDDEFPNTLQPKITIIKSEEIYDKADDDSDDKHFENEGESNFPSDEMDPKFAAEFAELQKQYAMQYGLAAAQTLTQLAEKRSYPSLLSVLTQHPSIYQNTFSAQGYSMFPGYGRQKWHNKTNNLPPPDVLSNLVNEASQHASIDDDTGKELVDNVVEIVSDNGPPRKVQKVTTSIRGQKLYKCDKCSYSTRHGYWMVVRHQKVHQNSTLKYETKDSNLDSSKDEESPPTMIPVPTANPVVQPILPQPDFPPIMETSSYYKCMYCNILFGDSILYGLHKGMHNIEKPFQCNRCGVVGKDKYEFTSHFYVCKF